MSLNESKGHSEFTVEISQNAGGLHQIGAIYRFQRIFKFKNSLELEEESSGKSRRKASSAASLRQRYLKSISQCVLHI